MEVVPASFLCPLTNVILTDPVQLGVSGDVFERSAINEWLTTRSTHPLTRQELVSRRLAP